MDGFLVEDDPSEDRSFTEIFHDVFPYYIAIGMTYDQFWNMDCTLVIDYRKADEIRRERENHSLWLQGAYVYDALARLAPALNGMAKRSKPKPYVEEPYPVTERAVAEKEVQKEKATFNKGMAFMEKFMAQNNKNKQE